MDGHPAVIGFLTDFGFDGAPATCRGVMLSICPTAQVIDISHSISKYAIRDGAFVLAAALPYLPVGQHVAVVDPGVGTARRGVALQTARGDVLIGPDNGLLVPGAQALGGVEAARVLENRALWLPGPSSTFHGRDIFAPVAAHLAAHDARFDEVGAVIDPDGLIRLAEAQPDVGPGRIATEIVYVDSFGNLRLAAGRSDLSTAFGAGTSSLLVRIGELEAIPATVADTFGAVEPGETLLYVDSSGHLALADNQGNLAGRIGAVAGAPAVIEAR